MFWTSSFGEEVKVFLACWQKGGYWNNPSTGTVTNFYNTLFSSFLINYSLWMNCLRGFSFFSSFERRSSKITDPRCLMRGPVLTRSCEMWAARFWSKHGSRDGSICGDERQPRSGWNRGNCIVATWAFCNVARVRMKEEKRGRSKQLISES